MIWLPTLKNTQVKKLRNPNIDLKTMCPLMLKESPIISPCLSYEEKDN